MRAIMFPAVCHLCGRVLPDNQEHVCATCMAGLPYTGHARQRGNALEERLAYIPEFEQGAGWIYYRPQSESSRLLERIKYEGFPRLAEWLGRAMARDMTDSGLLDGIDAVMPVPLHFMRRLCRGYNQSEMLARGVASVLSVPVVRLFRARRHNTQTRLTAERRRRNVRGVFVARRGARWPQPQPGQPLKLLLIDDVCTTGATLGALAEAVVAACPRVRLRVITLAVTPRQ